MSAPSGGAARRGGARSPGFSLIEVLLVMVIMGILAAIAIPLYLGSRDRAHNADAVEGGRTIMIAVLAYAGDRDVEDPWPVAADKALLVAAGAIEASEWPTDAFSDGADDMRPVDGPGDTTPGRYLYREAPDHAATGRHQIVVFRKGAAPFVIP